MSTECRSRPGSSSAICPSSDPRDIGRRIALIGNTSSGKTTLARILSRRLNVPHVELDALHWGPGWKPYPREQFRERVVTAVSGDAWVTDGNYSAVRDLIWQRASTLIWLDFPLPVVYWRLTRRTVRRLISREELWNGNRENLTAFFGPDSLYAWAWKTHDLRRRQYVEALRKPEHSHLQVVRLRSPRDVRRWVKSLHTYPP